MLAAALAGRLAGLGMSFPMHLLVFILAIVD